MDWRTLDCYDKTWALIGADFGFKVVDMGVAE